MNSTKNELLRKIHQAAELIRSLGNGVVLTGAGISTPSGIPDFRSPGNGLWTRYSPMEVASLTTFRYHPEKFFEWLRPLARQMIQAKPNASHHAFAELEQGGHIETIVTQNIDGLHPGIVGNGPLPSERYNSFRGKVLFQVFSNLN